MNKKDYEEFMKHCQVIQKIGDNGTLLKVNQSEELIVRRYLNNGCAEILPTLAQEKQLNHEHLQSIIDYCQLNEDSVVVFTQYFSHTLEEELEARRKSNTRFSIQQLQNILVSVVKGLQYLEDKSIGHGCISAKDIVISQNGTLKIVDPCLASSSPLCLTPGYFYSPQLLQYNYKQNNSSGCSLAAQNVDFFKNDIFSLGLLVIELGLLHCNVSQCLDYGEGKFDYVALQQFLNQFQCIFDSKSFINLLCGMLYQESEARLTSQGILNFIQDQFSSSDEDSDSSPSMISSYLSQFTSGQNDKTVCSFLLSQGPTNSQEESMIISRQSLLIQMPDIHNKTLKRPGGCSANRTGKTPLIKC